MVIKSLSRRIYDVLHGECRILPEDIVLVGVSGGIDSVFLLSQLYEMNQPVVAAVFNHGLRPESAEECAFVASFCRERNIPCICGEADAALYAAENNMGIEEAARDLRYRFLFKTAEAQSASAVATAHHANDQAETVLMHILRGTGNDGLCGMRFYSFLKKYSQTIPLVRPLLCIERAEIESYALENKMSYREDRSNTDLSYTRNCIRLDLIPKLEHEFNPQIVKALCRLAENASADKSLLDEISDKALLDAGFQKLSDKKACFRKKSYCSQSGGLRIRMMRRILEYLDFDTTDIGHQKILEADDFYMNARTNQFLHLTGDIWLRCEEDSAEILNNIDSDQQKYPQLSQNLCLECEIRDIEMKEFPLWLEKAQNNPALAVADAEKLTSRPFLRKIYAGERFDPYGLGGKRQKVSDFLVNSKIPKEYRPDLAVVADDSGIIWIPGLRICHRVSITEKTHEILIIKISYQEREK